MPLNGAELARTIRALMFEYSTDGTPETVTDMEILQRVNTTLRMVDEDEPSIDL